MCVLSASDDESSAARYQSSPAAAAAAAASVSVAARWMLASSFTLAVNCIVARLRRSSSLRQQHHRI